MASIDPQLDVDGFRQALQQAEQVGLDPLQFYNVLTLLQGYYRALDQAMHTTTDEARLVALRVLRGDFLRVRAKIYLGVANFYLERPARLSELGALSGFDPVSIGQLALLDGRELVSLHPLEGNLLCAQATKICDPSLTYTFALAALHEDPTNAEAQQLARDFAPALKRRDRELEGVGSSGELDCPLCCRIFIEPVTTGCGHTFCRACLINVLDHSSAQRFSGQRCPMCRAPIHIDPVHHPPTIVLQQLIAARCQAEVEERRKDAEQASSATPSTAPSSDSEQLLPLFVMSTTVPNSAVELNIFEPRYRLMARRCLQGTRLYCLVSHRMDGEGFTRVGVTVRISDCAVQPDGRYYLSGVAVDPVTIVGDVGEVDGYRVGRVKRIVPSPLTDDEREEVRQTLGSIMEKIVGIDASVQQHLPPLTNEGLEKAFWWLCDGLVKHGPFQHELLAEPSLLIRARRLSEHTTRFLNRATCCVA